MTSGAARYARVHEVFDAARRRDPAERAEFLRDACGGDETLRRDVESLLVSAEHTRNGADALSEERIESSRSALEAMLESADEAPAWLPEHIGGYRIVRRIGEGGMGVVYEAEQESPRRRVAIKLLHPLHATADRLRRFRQEAELLGRLRHPGIAQIHEAGTYDLGRGAQPFFAMEYVDGADLRTHCAREGLGARERLELLAQVADAVEYAHEQGVTHRDLKPDNVLVDEHGQPKVLDFGIARASRTSTALSTIVTEEGQLVGTLSYMAPEQLRAAPDSVTPRVDVYALGVLGFELLTGRLPHVIEDLPMTAAVALLGTTDAPRAGTVDRALRGDVETILGKALDSDPARRYESPAALAGDLRRYLDDRPIRARPPSRLYRARKFTRRNRALVGGTAATVVTLAAGVVIALSLAGRERDQRERADASALEARRSEVRAVSGLLESAQTLIDGGRGWDALRSHRLVPEAHRGWAWDLVARQLPNVLDVPPAANGWEFMGDDHLFGMGPARDRIMVVSVVDGRRRDLFVGERFDNVGWGTPGGLVLAWRASGDVMLLDLDAGVIRREWKADPETGRFHNSGSRGSNSDDGRVIVLQPEVGTAEVWIDDALVRTVTGLAERGNVRVDASGRRLFVRSARDRIDVIDLASGETSPLRGRRPGHEVNYPLLFEGGLLFGETRVTASRLEEGPATRPTVRVDLGPPLRFGDVDVNPEGSSVLRVPRDGRFVAISGGAPSLRDTRTGEVLFLTPYQDADGHIDPQDEMYCGLEVAPSGKRILVDSANRSPWVIELDPRRLAPDFDPRCLALRGHSSWVYHVAVSHDGSLVASAAPEDPLVRLWDARTGDPIATLARRTETYGSWDALFAFSSDDERLLMTTPMPGGTGAAVVEWTLATGAVETEWPETPVTGRTHGPLLHAFIDRLDPGPRDRLGRKSQMAGDGALTTWWTDETPDTPGRRWRVAAPAGSMDGVDALAIHPRLPRVAVVGVRSAPEGFPDLGGSGVLQVRDLDTGEVRFERDFNERLHCCAYDADGDRLAIGTRNGRVIIMDTEFDTVVLNFPAHGGAEYTYVYSIAWTPDGGRLVTGSGDGTVKIWDPRPLAVRDAEVARWQALCGQVAARTDLADAMSVLRGEERAAARIELIRRARLEAVARE